MHGVWQNEQTDNDSDNETESNEAARDRKWLMTSPLGIGSSSVCSRSDTNQYRSEISIQASEFL